MRVCGCFFFFNDTATTEIYTLSLHDALPISLYEPMGRPRREHEQLLQLAGSRLCFDMVQQALAVTCVPVIGPHREAGKLAGAGAGERGEGRAADDHPVVLDQRGAPDLALAQFAAA